MSVNSTKYFHSSTVFAREPSQRPASRIYSACFRFWKSQSHTRSTSSLSCPLQTNSRPAIFQTDHDISCLHHTVLPSSLLMNARPFRKWSFTFSGLACSTSLVFVLCRTYMFRTRLISKSSSWPTSEHSVSDSEGGFPPPLLRLPWDDDWGGSQSSASSLRSCLGDDVVGQLKNIMNGYEVFGWAHC